VSDGDDVGQLGEYRARFATFWQAADHMAKSIDALHEAVADLFDEDKLIAQAPDGEHVKVDVGHERERVRKFLDSIRRELDEIEARLDEGCDDA